MRVDDLATFIKAREAHRRRKEGDTRNFVLDPIIAKYRFCNVRREDDRVTRWIAENWRNPHSGDPYLWFAMVVARLFNLPSTLEAIGYPIPWKAVIRARLHAIRDSGDNVFNAAYIVSTNGRAMDKIDYVLDVVLKPMWRERGLVGPITADKAPQLGDLHERLMRFQGMGSFMAAQVVADVKYAAPYYDLAAGQPTDAADDWATFAASGPGSRRGLNRVMGRPVDAPWREKDWYLTLIKLMMQLSRKLPPEIRRGLHAQDIQNCLCEFDKYERARTGQGTPKQIYDKEA